VLAGIWVLIAFAALVWTSASSCAAVPTEAPLFGKTLRVDHSLTGGCMLKSITATPFEPTDICACAAG
jgi:hypothetical protein